MTTSPADPSPRPNVSGRATIVGLGLIGGSVGLALRSKGWHVSGLDADDEVAQRAAALGVIDEVGEDLQSDLVMVATPVTAASAVISDILASGRWRPDVVVTDVASVKASLVAAVDHPRFVGGHPMAGSEQVGVDGATGDLFVGATWVLTPTTTTDPLAYASVRSMADSLGARVMALDPADHDRMVAVVSHVPHLTAATLMTLAVDEGQEHGALLQLAAGGFRDMTRIAAGRPDIWPGICADNSVAIIATLDRLVDGLREIRSRVEQGEMGWLLDYLTGAAEARRALSEGAPRPESLVEIRIPVEDRPGAFAGIAVLATDLGINIYDVEIAHSAEGDRGVLVLVIDADSASLFTAALSQRGHRSSAVPLGGQG